MSYYENDLLVADWSAAARLHRILDLMMVIELGLALRELK